MQASVRIVMGMTITAEIGLQGVAFCLLEDLHG
jgi:hypothetical protein